MEDVMDANLLLQHRDFVARVARRLIDDEAQVEDVVQDTFMAALRKPTPARPKAWLARVAHNLSVDRLRRRDARTRREEKAARPEGVVSTAELAGRVAAQQRVVDEVLALDEPYRSVVLLRYYEDLPPRDVAARLGVPVNTARTRLRRALSLLRGKLDRATLAVLALSATGSSAAAGGIMVLTMKKTAVLLAVLFAAALFTTARSLDWFEAPETAATRSDRLVREGAAGAAPEAHAEIPAGEAGVVTATLLGELPAECEDLGGVRVTVRTPDGHVAREEIAQLGAMRVVYRRTAEDMRVELSGPRVVRRVFPLPARETDLGEVTLARAISFGGRVFGPDKQPLEGAIVYWAGPGDPVASAPTGPDGRYRIELPFITSTITNQDGLLHSVALHVQWKDSWGGAFGARPSGFSMRYDFTATLEARPVLWFPDARGGTVTLYSPEPFLSARPPEPFAIATIGSDGRVAPWWPPWTDARIIVRAVDGEEVQVTAPREWVVSSRRYDVRTDPQNVATLRLGFDAPVPVGAFVRVYGDWSPDGLRIDDDGSFQTERGMVGFSLYARVPEDGVVRWQLAAEKAATGVFMPETWVFEHEGRLMQGEFDVNNAEDVPSSGGTLPPIGGNRAVLFSTGGVPFGCSELVLRDATGAEVMKEAWPAQQACDFYDAVVVRVRTDLSDWPAFAQITFRFEVLEERPEVRLSRKELARAIAEGRPIAVAAPAAAPSAPVRVRVRVIDREGNPVPNAMVGCVTTGELSTFGTTDRSGRTTVTARGGPHTVLAWNLSTGDGAAVDGVSSGGREVTLRLKPPVRRRFRLVGPEGEPRGDGISLLSPGGVAGSRQATFAGDGWRETPSVAAEMFTLYAVAGDPHGKRLYLKVPLRDVKQGQTLRLSEIKR